MTRTCQIKLRRAFHRIIGTVVIGWTCVLPALAIAQSTVATVVGTVADPSGGLVPGATITFVNLNTQATRAVVTDGSGNYVVANLDPGPYRITATLAGFSDATRQLDLLARQNVRADLSLALSGAAESVEVRASNPVIETERATIDNSKSGDEINRLALNFRATNNPSPIVVATLAQGVQQDRNGSISIAGNLPFQTSFSIDGISSQRTRAGGASRDMFPSVESIEEFKVSSANNNAEFMQVTDLTTTTKSGTNNLRGSGFWFFQDAALNAVDRFAPKDASGKPIKPDVRANSFGGSLGGPVVRSRTFFFGAYEGVRRPNETTLSQIVPPDAFRRGDLSSIGRQLVNPFTGQPYPNNQIPINPVSAKALEAFFERQNQSTGAAVGQPNYVANAAGDFNVNGFDARVDHAFTSKQRVFGRYTFKDVETVGMSGNWNPKQGERSQQAKVRQLAAAHNWVLSSSWLNELRGGYNTTADLDAYANSGKGGELITPLGLIGLPGIPTSGGFPAFEFTDGSFISSGGDKPRNILSKVVQFNDNLTYVRSGHTLKAGVDVQYVEYKDQITFFSGEEFGRYQFSGVYTGNAFADFLVGAPQFTGYSINTPDANPYATHFAGYLQDDWKPTDKLTVNLGLRYDLRGPMQDRSNQMGNFDRNFPGGRVIVANDGVLAKIPALVRNSVPNTPFVTAAEAGLPESLRFTDKNNVNPRLSVAYRLGDGKTVVRGGVGRYTVPLYGAVNYSMVATVTAVAAAFSNTTPAPAFVFPNISSATTAQGALPAGSLDFRRANQVDLRDPSVTQWTATVDRDLGWNTGLRVSYVGSKTKDLVYSPDLNQVPSNTQGYAAVRHTRPFTDWNVVTTRDNGPQSRYDALGLELSKRFSRGVAFNASYTLAKNIADHGGAVPGNYTGENGATTLDLFRGDSDRGNEPFTRRHRFVSTFFAEVPFGRGRAIGTNMSRALDLLVGGWDLTGIALAQSGPYLTPFFSNADPSGTGTTVRGFTASQRPDCVGDGLIANPTSTAYFDVADFVRPANNIGRFGNCKVGILEGPGTTAFSLTVGKDLKIAGSSKLRFEASFANLFNLENLDIPGNMNITSSAFGRITRTQSVDQAGPRTAQFSLRYTF
ncbi:MAG TPA: TonB-dependent receptor [Vicinamibacterales bacterium]|nr:TonB-dependent receptor [Vicinamibacterales bacterium]